MLSLSGGLPVPATAADETVGSWVVHTRDPGNGSAPESGDEELFATRVDGTRTVRLTTSGSCADLTAHSSPDGRWLSWVQKCGRTVDLLVAPISYTATGDPQLGAATNLSSSLGTTSERWPQFSPDGTKLAFMRSGGGNFDIWRADFSVVGGAPRITEPTRVVRLGPGSVEDCCVSWSPDGRHLVFASNVNKDSHSFNLYRVESSATEVWDARTNVDGSADGSLDVTVIDQLTSTASYEGTPAYDADGTVLFRCNCANADVYRIDPVTRVRTRLTTYSGMDRTPEGYPGGIVYSRQNSSTQGYYEIYVAGRTGATPRNITNHAASDLDPTWVRPQS